MVEEESRRGIVVLWLILHSPRSPTQPSRVMENPHDPSWPQSDTQNEEWPQPCPTSTPAMNTPSFHGARSPIQSFHDGGRGGHVYFIGTRQASRLVGELTLANTTRLLRSVSDIACGHRGCLVEEVYDRRAPCVNETGKGWRVGPAGNGPVCACEGGAVMRSRRMQTLATRAHTPVMLR